MNSVNKRPLVENYDRSDREQDEDALVELDLDDLEDMLNDITYSPPQTSVVVRSAFVLDQDHDAQQKLERKPATWTQLSFAAYVYALTRPSSKLAHRKELDSTEYARGYIDAVSAELATMFTDPKLLHHTTNDALGGCLNISLATEISKYFVTSSTILMIETTHSQLRTSTQSCQRQGRHALSILSPTHCVRCCEEA